jgi:HAD superfamily hydrolase (TIGR01484 family)
MSLRQKLLAVDIDGTLLRSDGDISGAVTEGLASLSSHGWQTALVSARPPASVKAILNRVGLTGPAICLNGALVLDAAGDIVAEWTMSEGTMQCVVESVETIAPFSKATLKEAEAPAAYVRAIGLRVQRLVQRYARVDDAEDTHTSTTTKRRHSTSRLASSTTPPGWSSTTPVSRVRHRTPPEFRRP